MHSEGSRAYYENLYHHRNLKTRTATFTTSTAAMKPTATDDNNQSNPPPPQPQPVLLYQRSKSRTFFPRTLIAATTGQTLYWTWYLYDFTVALSIDPTIGYAGLTLAIAMSFGATLYPPSLVHSIRLIRGSTQSESTEQQTKIGIRTYSLPFVTPSREKLYQLGDVHFTTPQDVTDILTKHEGDLTQIDKHIPLTASDRRIPLLLQVDGDKDVVLPEEEEGDDEKEDKKEYGSVWFRYLSPSKTVVDSGGGGGIGGVGARRYVSKSKKGKILKKGEGRKGSKTHEQRQKRLERIIQRRR